MFRFFPTNTTITRNGESDRITGWDDTISVSGTITENGGFISVSEMTGGTVIATVRWSTDGSVVVTDPRTVARQPVAPVAAPVRNVRVTNGTDTFMVAADDVHDAMQDGFRVA